MGGLDYRLEQWINGPAGGMPLLDGIMRQLSIWAEPAFLALIVLWFLAGWLRHVAPDRQGAITAALAAGGGLLVNQGITHLWQRPRPFVAHPDTVHLLLKHAADPSFPSDHAAPAFAIAVVLLGAHRRAGMIALLGAALISYARVYCGDHYPGDVLGGAVVGIVVALILTGLLHGVMERIRYLVDRVMIGLHVPGLVIED